VADRIEYVVLPKSLDTGQQQVWDSVKAEFELMKENSYWQVFHRIGH
jgi:hypothetical protein